ncbi:MAG TPA: peptidoglycan DD-metalloendopeptidase family protein [Myxococcota bacterium]|jgi:murein DD-endopeptidase MepM/ murein hydrolase activator NlpD
MKHSMTRRRTVSQTRLLCATVFTAAFVVGMATAFAAGFRSRAVAAAPEAPQVEAAALSPDIALAGLPEAAPSSQDGIQLASLETVPPPFALPPVEQPDRVYTNGVIARGETLAYALGQQGIPRLTVHQITSELAKHFDFRRTQPGHAYRITQDADGRVIEFRYSTSPMEGFTVALEGDAYLVRRDELQLEPREVRIAGVVTTSLHDAVKALGESPQLASDFADIFAWDIDFTRAVRPGDEFRILYERLYFVDENGKESYLRPGRILAAQYSGSAGEHSAVYYESQPGQGGYYHADGSSVQRQFLQAPLRFARISSRYSQARHHPILRITRPHQGIDYAAPAGTPIWAVSDGRVIYRGYAGGFGNLVKIRHSRGYVSYYGHLSRFGPGLKVGQRVRQKQVIGYVGSTGLSTGPHVCFRIAQDGRYFNPAKLHTPAGDAVTAQRRPDFLASRDSLLARLDAGTVSAADEAL